MPALAKPRKASIHDTATVARRNLKKNVVDINTKKPATLGTVKKASNKAPKTVKGKEKYTPRVREPNEALPPTLTWKGTTYKTGDGDYVYHAREGSDHSHLKSFGDRT